MTDTLIHACFAVWLTALSAGVICTCWAQVRVNKATLEWMKAIDAIVNQKAAREKAKEKP